jgi:hypothetical protein
MRSTLTASFELSGPHGQKRRPAEMFQSRSNAGSKRWGPLVWNNGRFSPLFKGPPKRGLEEACARRMARVKASLRPPRVAFRGKPREKIGGLTCRGTRRTRLL